MGRAFLASISDRPVWISLLVCLVLELLWGRMAGIGFSAGRVIIVVAALLSINTVYCRMRPAPADPVAVMLESAAAYIAYTAVWAPITYLSARNGHAVIDPALSHLDHLMGFDWGRWNRFIESMPAVNVMLHIVYASLEPQAVVAILYLPLVKGGRRGFALVRHGMVAAALTSVLFRLFPAMGAQPADWTAELTALRGSAPLSFDLMKLKGIVSFPSFHTVLAILFIYAFRGTRLGLVAIVLNVLMIVSALSVGSHYLTDIIGGAAVAAIAIAAVEWIETFPLTRSANPRILAKPS